MDREQNKPDDISKICNEEIIAGEFGCFPKEAKMVSLVKKFMIRIYQLKHEVKRN